MSQHVGTYFANDWIPISVTRIATPCIGICGASVSGIDAVASIPGLIGVARDKGNVERTTLLLTGASSLSDSLT